MKENFVNGRFLLGEEYSEALSGEHFKKSGDLVINQYPVVGLYLYRHAIELQLKSLVKRYNIKFNHNHALEKIMELLNAELNKREILTNEEKDFMSNTILSYKNLDERGSTLRYPNSKEGEHFITSDIFIEKNKINNFDNPYFYTIKLDKIKVDINKLFEIFFKIHDFLEEEKYYNETYEKEPF